MIAVYSKPPRITFGTVNALRRHARYLKEIAYRLELSGHCGIASSVKKSADAVSDAWNALAEDLEYDTQSKGCGHENT